MKLLNTLNKNTVEKSPNSKLWSHYSKIKLLLSSVMPQFSLWKPKLKLTKSQLKLESVSSPQSIFPSQLDPLVWIHPKSTSSTLWTSQPRSSKVKSKSPKILECVPLVRRSKPQKPLFWKNSTWDHSNMVWR